MMLWPPLVKIVFKIVLIHFTHVKEYILCVWIININKKEDYYSINWKIKKKSDWRVNDCDDARETFWLQVLIMNKINK